MICKKENAKTEKREAMRGGNGTVMLEHPFEELPSGCRLVSVLTLEKGAGIGEHEHRQEAELFYVLSGAAIYTENGIPFMLAAGDSAMVRNGRHSVEGISDEPCRILAVLVNDVQ